MTKLVFKKLDVKLLARLISVDDRKKYDVFFKNLGSESIVFSEYLMEYLLFYIDKHLMKTFITDINIKRVNNEFKSQDKKEQYNEFIDSEEYIKNLKKNNVLLFDNLKISINQIIESYILFIRRFNRDKLILENKFNVKFPIKNLEIGLGDSHNKHSNVIKLTFSNNKKIIYKPRNSFGDLGISHVVEWLRKYKVSSFYIPKMEIYNDYCWNEEISYIKTSKNKLKNVYFQLGTLAAIAYMFKISDLHMENIIVSNGNVYLVDCETIFQDNFYSTNENATECIYSKLRNSVLMTCLFPAHLSGNENDLSGICGKGGQVFKHRLSKIVNINSSDIKLVKTDYINENKKNLPKGVEIDPRDYLTDIIRGFQKTIKTILSNKRAFINADFWNYFSRGKYRIIFKNTSTYSVILSTSSNPYYFRNRKNLHDLLNLLKSNDNNTMINKKIFDSEIQDLCSGNIPFFYKNGKGEKVFNSNGQRILFSSDFKSIDFYKEKMLNIDKEEINFQIELIKISMAKPVKNWDLGKREFYDDSKLLQINIDNEKIITEANRILDIVIKNSVQRKKFVNWYNISIDSNSTWVISPCNYYLYNGLTGILLVFALAYKITGKSKYKQIFDKGLNELTVFERKNTDNNISVFNGIGSILYFYFYLYLLTNENNYLLKTKYYIKLISENLTENNKLDLLDGISGVLIVLCNIKKRESALVPIILIKKCTNIILEKWNSRECWYSDIIMNQHLNGMAHGLSGITYALCLANVYLKDNNIDNKIMNAINLENQSIVDNNWIDLRNKKNRKKKGFPDPIHWCHGASGIGLNRIILNNILNKNILNDNIKMAKEKSLTDGFGGSDCLCHGNLGNIDLFLTDFAINENKSSLKIAQKIVTNLCNSTNDWICGIPQYTHVDNLMTGMTGIVYELFRTVYPKEIPSILLLDF